MTTDEARELRAALAEALDPLYAARVGTIPDFVGVLKAIPVLHRIDRALLAVLNKEVKGEGHDDRLRQDIQQRQL